MKCNKCGTPIIPGEDTCRICGNKADFSKREAEVEIIDFPEEQESPVVNSPVLENNEVELPDLDNIINFTNPNINLENNSEKTEKIQIVSEPVVPEVEQKEETKEKIEYQTEPKASKKNVLDKVKEEKTKKVKKEKTDGKISSSVGVILLTLILLCSLAGNIYLFIMNSNDKAEKNNKPIDNEVVYSKVAYKDYKMTIPSTWITEKKESNLLIYDDTQNWAASIQIIDKADYDAFVSNKDTLVQTLGGLKYQFTSNYSKKVDGKDYYLFKGKYYNYSVYVIVTALNDKLFVTDLKFKGEVDDILLNNILTVAGTIKDKETEDLFKENFEFVDFSNQISSISQNKE